MTLDLSHDQLETNISVAAHLDRFAEGLREPLRFFIARIKGTLPGATRADIRTACLEEVLPVARGAPTAELRQALRERARRVVNEEVERSRWI